MKIDFEYLRKECECFAKTRWDGCCCMCEYHHEVYQHCGHSPRESGDCVCNKSLGFYVCTIFRRAHLSGAHGFCEMYVHRSDKLESAATVA